MLNPRFTSWTKYTVWVVRLARALHEVDWEPQATSCVHRLQLTPGGRVSPRTRQEENLAISSLLGRNWNSSRQERDERQKSQEKGISWSLTIVSNLLFWFHSARELTTRRLPLNYLLGPRRAPNKPVSPNITRHANNWQKFIPFMVWASIDNLEVSDGNAEGHSLRRSWSILSWSAVRFL